MNDGRRPQTALTLGLLVLAALLTVWQARFDASHREAIGRATDQRRLPPAAAMEGMRHASEATGILAAGLSSVETIRLVSRAHLPRPYWQSCRPGAADALVLSELRAGEPGFDELIAAVVGGLRQAGEVGPDCDGPCWLEFEAPAKGVVYTAEFHPCGGGVALQTYREMSTDPKARTLPTEFPLHAWFSIDIPDGHPLYAGLSQETRIDIGLDRDPRLVWRSWGRILPVLLAVALLKLLVGAANRVRDAGRSRRRF